MIRIHKLSGRGCYLDLPPNSHKLFTGKCVAIKRENIKEVNQLLSVLKTILMVTTVFLSVNPLTPMSDQDRLSPYNINTISTR